MKISPIYKNNKQVDIENYLSKCGVKNVDKWLSHSEIENFNNYFNVDKSWIFINEFDNNKPIYILVDCDVDGFMSASIWYIFLKRLNMKKIIPLFHTGKQHGINDEEIFEYVKQQEPSKLILPDSSSNDIKWCNELNELGWDILITDHHEFVSAEAIKFNEKTVLVNNQFPTVENQEGSGALVSWKVCDYYDHNLAKDLISYVAIANIGDSTSLLTAENETFRYWGMRDIHPYLKPFVKAFNRDSATNNKAFSFGLVTNINSLIRLGTQEQKKQLFYALCGEIEPNEIVEICSKLHSKQSNETKRLLEKKVEIVSNDKVVIAHLNEKSNLSGLVANKMLSQYNKPILLVHERNNGEMAGSVRSPFDIKEILNQTELFNYNQGHECAFGTSYQKENEQSIIECLSTLESHSEPPQSVFMSMVTKDIPNWLYEFTERYKDIFGKDIPIPRVHIQPFGIYNTEIQSMRGNTLKFRRDGIDFLIYFASNSLKEKLHLDEIKKKYLQFEFIGELGYNYWNGNKYKQVIIDTNCIEIKDYDNKEFI